MKKSRQVERAELRAEMKNGARIGKATRREKRRKARDLHLPAKAASTLLPVAMRAVSTLSRAKLR